MIFQVKLFGLIPQIDSVDRVIFTTRKYISTMETMQGQGRVIHIPESYNSSTMRIQSLSGPVISLEKSYFTAQEKTTEYNKEFNFNIAITRLLQVTRDHLLKPVFSVPC